MAREPRYQQSIMSTPACSPGAAATAAHQPRRNAAIVDAALQHGAFVVVSLHARRRSPTQQDTYTAGRHLATARSV